jgi:hypothetical protein
MSALSGWASMSDETKTSGASPGLGTNVATNDCANSNCTPESSAAVLNRNCYCVTVDPSRLRQSLHSEFGDVFSPAIWAGHEHLFATSPVFVDQHSLTRMAAVVAAVEEIVCTRTFEEAVMSWAPDVARFAAGPLGGLLSYDFHLAEAGPRLIEINTNPGGAFLNAMLGRFQTLCCNEDAAYDTVPVGAVAEDSLLETFFTEWRMQRADARLEVVAIVDETPAHQYLYPEFLLVAELLRRRGTKAVVCDPSELVERGGRLLHGEAPVDLIYNRLTDFSLASAEHAAIRAAYLAGSVVLTPHPRAHALYADKRNLALLCDPDFLRRCGASKTAIDLLQQSVPRTELVSAENRSKLWARRRGLFFKPATGYGSRAAYRGDKLTKRVWEDMPLSAYVAQELVKPSQRRLGPSSDQALKVDVRVYAYAGQVKFVAARMYQGQTTNMRTPGGGFAAVLTRSQ